MKLGAVRKERDYSTGKRELLLRRAFASGHRLPDGLDSKWAEESTLSCTLS